MSYTTKTAVENYLLTTIDSSFDASITSYISAITKQMDEMAGYPIYSTEETTRKYDGNGKRELVIDPVHTITEITVDDVVKTPIQLPHNEDAKTSLLFKTDYFPHDIGNVSVTGIHALETTLPPDVKHACTVFVSLIVAQIKDKTGGVKSEKIGEYSVTFRDEKDRLDFELAKDIVLSYKRLAF